MEQSPCWEVDIQLTVKKLHVPYWN